MTTFLPLPQERTSSDDTSRWNQVDFMMLVQIRVKIADPVRGVVSATGGRWKLFLLGWDRR
jgi:hypothetical protein